MHQVTSVDGTTIAYDELGDGPAVILVSGGSVDRTSNADLAALLAEHFTVFNYDRRGRGPSGDTQPYAVMREVEDIAAVVTAAGGSAYLFGSSSGAALALQAASQLATITKLAAWEPPFRMDKAERPPADMAQTLHDLVAAGKRDGAVEYFFTKGVNLPSELVDSFKTQPFWQGQVELAHTLEYDAAIMGDTSLPETQLAAVHIPTLVVNGSESFPYMPEAADAVAKHVAGAQRVTLDGQQHNFAAEVLAPVLTTFFSS
jgi:pimeloyl-ACP methyl ester carboxylesterase